MKYSRLAILAAAAMTLGACTTTDTTYQLAGHPYKTEVGCARKAPIGKFDRDCDHPTLGYRSFSQDTGVGISGTPGSGGTI